MNPLHRTPADTAPLVEGSPDIRWRLLQSSARLLLEYNERSGHIRRQLARLATHLGVAASTAVDHRSVAVAAPDGRVFHTEAPEFRINVAVSVAAQQVLDQLCAGRLSLPDAAGQLDTLERTSSRHGPWLAVVMCGLAAACLAVLLHADRTAVVTSGISAALGLVARQALARRTTMLLAPPFVAGLIGALLGGLVIRVASTATPNLCLVVPALMLVPGPHLINSVEDILENEMQAGIGRLFFATVILFGAALGVVVGAWLTVGHVTEAVTGAQGAPLALVPLSAFAGAASCGFAVFYNAPWRIVWISVGCGVLGYSMRGLGLEWGAGLPASTFLASLGIGIAAGVASLRLRLPFASLAFAGAVPMIPGVLIYQSIAAAMRLSAAGGAADPTLAVAVLSPFLQASFVVAAMAIGLVAGLRIAASFVTTPP